MSQLKNKPSTHKKMKNVYIKKPTLIEFTLFIIGVIFVVIGLTQVIGCSTYNPETHKWNAPDNTGKKYTLAYGYSMSPILEPRDPYWITKYTFSDLEFLKTQLDKQNKIILIKRISNGEVIVHALGVPGPLDTWTTYSINYNKTDPDIMNRWEFQAVVSVHENLNPITTLPL
jgi:hypothetical protein